MSEVIFPFQERVVAEKNELQNKIEKLEMFFLTPVFTALGRAEQRRLKRQLTYMQLYHNVLEERIEEFDTLNECSN